MELTEEKAKELLDFLARKAGYRCCKLMKNPETGMFELVFSNEKLRMKYARCCRMHRDGEDDMQ